MSTMNPTVKRILPWTPLVAALILGLILGLLIGWVWWPVSWTNASLVDLSPGQQAAYIGSVAEAYNFDGSQDKTRHMQSRLAPLGEATGEAVTAAIAYYRGLPTPDEVMVSNIAKMAMDLNIPVDAAMIAAAPGTSETAAPAGEAAVAEAAATPEQESSGSGIFTWLFAVILSLGLLGAGFYLLMRLRAPSELTDAMKDPSAPPGPGELQPAAGTTQTTAWGKGAAATQASASDDDLTFEDEDEEEPAARFSNASGEPGAPDADDDYTPVTPRYASARAEEANYALYTGTSFDAAVSDDAFADDDEADAEEASLDADEAAAKGGSPPAAALPAAALPAAALPAAALPAASRSSGPGGGPVPADAPPVDIDTLTPPGWAAVETKNANPKTTSKGKTSGGPTAVTAPAAATVTAVPTSPSAGSPANSQQFMSRDSLSAETVITTGVAVTSGRSAVQPAAQPAAQPAVRPASRPVAQFTLQYHAGLPGYIEAHNITDPVTGNYIGECGMCVSGKNPVLHDNPNQVIALEVWMYDKMDARDSSDSTRILLCPYAVARNLAQAFGDGSGRGLIEARKGARFQVEGKNLVLQGELQDVEYDSNGVFTTARVLLNIRTQAG